jgi:peptidoglycan hydrolase-like protein with peptidoglycan-binding domain
VLRVGVAALLAASALLLAQPALGAGAPHVAALQVALASQGVYGATIDGVLGPKTRAAVRRFQRRAGLSVDGVVGPRTRRALGRLGRHRLGSRVLRRGRVGWDVAALQFALAWHGFAGGAFDGVYGPRTAEAVEGFQRYAGLAVDGIAGRATLRTLAGPLPSSPLSLAWPVDGGVSSGFGPRGRRFHEGLDLSAGKGTLVGAAAGGVVTFADWNDGFGRLVVVAHGSGVVTLYAHLSRFAVTPGTRVSTGDVVGRVGSSGHATGPHLHFEVHLRGAAVNPLTALS